MSTPVAALAGVAAYLCVCFALQFDVICERTTVAGLQDAWLGLIALQFVASGVVVTQAATSRPARVVGEQPTCVWITPLVVVGSLSAVFSSFYVIKDQAAYSTVALANAPLGHNTYWMTALFVAMLVASSVAILRIHEVALIAASVAECSAHRSGGWSSVEYHHEPRDRLRAMLVLLATLLTLALLGSALHRTLVNSGHPSDSAPLLPEAIVIVGATYSGCFLRAYIPAYRALQSHGGRLFEVLCRRPSLDGGSPVGCG